MKRGAAIWVFPEKAISGVPRDAREDVTAHNGSVLSVQETVLSVQETGCGTVSGSRTGSTRSDEDVLLPSGGYTTLFRRENLAHAERAVTEDLAHSASVEDPTPLAVLALRGIEVIRIDEAVWAVVGG